MNDTIVTQVQDGARWLMLIHQVPPRPAYLRVKVRRRLLRIGAVAVKSTVYVVPHTAESLEDLHWVRSEIMELGGSAVICDVSFVAGISDGEVATMLGERGRDAVVAEVEQVEPGRTWVTRAGVHVDRMASAWLIGRFIDPQARFAFVSGQRYRPRAGELRFDMYDGEYTHEGERCTFEVLARRFGLTDPALDAIGRVVRDIDCKAERYSRPETAGVSVVLRGIVELHATDEARVERGGVLFDELYVALQGA